MNILASVYCYLHQTMIDKGLPPSRSTNTGNLILSLTIFMYVFGIVFLLVGILPDFSDSMEDFFETIFGRKSGKVIGQLSVVLGIALIFPILKFTIGSERNFNRIINDYEQLEGEEKTMVAFKGLVFFYGSIAFFTVTIIFVAAMSML